MKIIQVVNVRWFNATAWYGLYLSRLLRDAGHDVLVMVQPGTPPEAKAREWGLETWAQDLNTSNPARQPRLYMELRRLVSGLKPDVVNCHRGESFLLWCLLRKELGGFRLVRTRGDQRPPRNNWANRLLHTRLADAVVVTNSTMAAHFRKVMGVPSEKLWRIIGGVDTDAFRYDKHGRVLVRSQYGFGPEHTVIGLLGRLDPVKGQRELIEAVSLLRHVQRLPNLRLLLVGHDSVTSEEQVRTWLRHWNMEDAAVLTGTRADVAACISAMDIGVVASLWSEAVARAALEIMACDRPLLGTRVGVMPDLLSEDALVAPGDASALAASLQRLLLDEGLRSTLLRRQQSRMSQLGGREFLRKTLSLYQGLLDS